MIRRLLTPDQLAQIPALFAQKDQADPTAYARLYSPYLARTWFILEYNPQQDRAYCYELSEGEGKYLYVSLQSLEEREGLVRGVTTARNPVTGKRFWAGIQRRVPTVIPDLEFTPRSLSLASPARQAEKQ